MSGFSLAVGQPWMITRLKHDKLQNNGSTLMRDDLRQELGNFPKRSHEEKRLF